MSKHIIGRPIDPCQQLELFAGANQPAPPQEDPECVKALDWLNEHLETVVVDGQERHGFDMRAMWEFLGQPYSDFRSWGRAKRKKLTEGVDYWKVAVRATNSTHRPAPPIQKYIVRPSKARDIFVTDASKKAEAIRAAFWQLTEIYASLRDELREQPEARQDTEEAFLRRTQKRINFYLRLGKEWDFIQARIEGIPARKGVIGGIAGRGVDQKAYAMSTNAVYKNGPIGMTAAEIRRHRNVPDSQPARDGLRPFELYINSATEAKIMEELEANPEIRGNKAVVDLCAEVSSRFKHLK